MPKSYITLLCTAILLTSCTQKPNSSENHLLSPQHAMASEIKHPLTEADKLVLDRPVVDTANVFSPSERQQLEHKIRQLYHDDITQIGIVTVPTTHGKPIFDYSMQIADKWKLGTKEKDNGLLIVMAMNDRKIQVLTGIGIEHSLTDTKLKNIIDKTITPQFSKRQYYQGIDKGIDEMVAIIKKSL